MLLAASGGRLPAPATARRGGARPAGALPFTLHVLPPAHPPTLLLLRRCCGLYRYLLQFGPQHPHHRLRLHFCAGWCPCCLRICVRWGRGSGQDLGHGLGVPVRLQRQAWQNRTGLIWIDHACCLPAGRCAGARRWWSCTLRRPTQSSGAQGPGPSAAWLLCAPAVAAGWPLSRLLCSARSHRSQALCPLTCRRLPPARPAAPRSSSCLPTAWRTGCCRQWRASWRCTRRRWVGGKMGGWAGRWRQGGWLASVLRWA